jgi:hypothetical protein
MHKHPEAFLEHYKKEGKPLFYIHKGESDTSKVLKRFTKRFALDDPDERKERLEQGAEELDDFFSSYEYGEVLIVCMDSVQGDKKGRNYHYVSWGEKPAKYGSKKTASIGGVNEMAQQFAFFQSLMQPQQEMMMRMFEMKEDLRDLQRENDELRQGGQSSIGDVAMMELVSCINPAFKWLTGQKSSPTMPIPQQQQQQQQAAIGTTKAADNQAEMTEESQAAATEATETPTATPVANGQANTNANLSVDFVLKAMVAVQKKHFPEYHLHVIAAGIVQLLDQYGAMVKGTVTPILDKIVADSQQQKSA